MPSCSRSIGSVVTILHPLLFSLIKDYDLYKLVYFICCLASQDISRQGSRVIDLLHHFQWVFFSISLLFHEFSISFQLSGSYRWRLSDRESQISIAYLSSIVESNNAVIWAVTNLTRISKPRNPGIRCFRACPQMHQRS